MNISSILSVLFFTTILYLKLNGRFSETGPLLNNLMYFFMLLAKLFISSSSICDFSGKLRCFSKEKLNEVVDLKVIAEKTKGFVGAELEALVKEAAILAMRQMQPQFDNEPPIPKAFLLRVKIRI